MRMRRGSGTGNNASGARGFALCACILALLAVAWPASPIAAQTFAWQIGMLSPPGFESPAPSLVDVAIAGDRAFSAYAGTANSGYRVYVRTRGPDSWGPPELLVQGLPEDGTRVRIDVDADLVAVGLPDAVGGGRVDIYLHTAEAGWQLEHSFPSPHTSGSFGSRVSIRQNLLVVTSANHFADSFVHSYIRMDAPGSWSDAGYTESMYFSFGPLSAVTDGERIATCSELSCMTLYSPSPGVWQGEASTGWVDPGRPVELYGNWLFVPSGAQLKIYRRVGTHWGLHQEVPGVAAFDVAAGRLVLRLDQASGSGMRVFEVDESGFWAPDFSGPVASGPVAIAGARALFGEQSLEHDGNSWIQSGAAAGLQQQNSSRFGAGLAISDTELWIGSPGYSSSDSRSGASFAFPATVFEPSAMSLSFAPASPSLGLGVGEVIATDGLRVAIASRSTIPSSSTMTRVSILDAASHHALQHIDLPETVTPVVRIDLAIEADTLAVSRFPQGIGDMPSVIVFRHMAGSFVPVQTIGQPPGAPSGVAFGDSVKLRGDWLLSGRLMFRRMGDSDYLYVGALELPAGSVFSGQIAMRGDILVAGTLDITSKVGFVYAFDADAGWVRSGSIGNGGFVISGRCRRLSIGEHDMACLATELDKLNLYRAIPDASGLDWQLVGAGPVTGLQPLTWRTARMLMSGDRVIIGWPDMQATADGQDTGRVAVMTFNESIFGSGFDTQ